MERTAPLMRKLVQVQGAQQTSSDAPFRDFISGVGNPLVLVYESQVASLLMSSQRQKIGDLVVLYPDTTVSSDHTLVPLTDHGREPGELLSTDPGLRELAVRHGFRPQGAAAEFITGVHVVARAVRRDVPESVDAYLRTRWWTRLAPGARAPEEELERQVALLHGEAQELVDGLREAEELRQRSHTKSLEDRGGGGPRRTSPAKEGRPPEP
ncbi:hypothetical protein ACIQRK_03030 [Streptomyces anulatus]